MTVNRRETPEFRTKSGTVAVPLNEIVGHMRIARRAGGKIVAAAWEEIGGEADIAGRATEWRRCGLTVERVTIRKCDPLPEWYCSPGERCVCRDPARTAQQYRTGTPPA